MSRQNTVFNWLPCSVVFISTASGDNRDIMTATAMFVSEKEPLVAVSFSKNHLTDQLIKASGEFTIAIASQEQKELAVQLGSMRGDETDKIERLSLAMMTTREGKPSIPEGSSAWMICQVESELNVNGYRLVVGRVVEQADLGKSPMIWHNNNYFALTSV